MTADLRALPRGRRAASSRPSAPPAAVIYRRAQALPYRLALLTIAVWFVIAVVGALVARLHLGFDLDDTIILVDRDARARGRRRDLRAAVASRRAAPAARAPDAALPRAGAQHRAVAVAAQQADAVVRRRRAARVRHGAAVGLRPVQEPRDRRGRPRSPTSACAGCAPRSRPSSAPSPTPPTEDAVRASLRRIVGDGARCDARSIYYIDDAGELLARRRRPDGRAEAALVRARADRAARRQR